MSVNRYSLTADDMRREYMREYKRAWRQKNADKVREYQRKWRRNNPEKVAMYTERYWEKKAAEFNRGSE